jgi:hypothetical protein
VIGPVKRWERRRARLVARRAKATAPAEHLAAGIDYLRGALADPGVPESRREQVAREAATTLVGLADRLSPDTRGGGHRG